MKHVIAGLLIAGLGVSTAACEASSGGGGDAAPTGKPVQVEAKEILKQFEQNEAAADGKYKGKALEVSGVVEKVDTEFFDDEQYVVQVGSGERFALWTVNCNDQSAEDVAKLKKGQKITVVGAFDDGGDLGIELKDCKVVQ